MVAKKSVSLIFATIIFWLLFLPFLSFAQTEVPPISFQPLVGIPGIGSDQTSNFGAYLNALYYLAISIAALIAVLKIIIAGAKYMLSGTSVSSTQSAKSDIKGALIGLLIIIGAVVILNTINSDLTAMRALDNLSELEYDNRDYLGEALAHSAELQRMIEECADAGTENCVVISTTYGLAGGFNREQCQALGGIHRYNNPLNPVNFHGTCTIMNPGDITNNRNVCDATNRIWDRGTCTGCPGTQTQQCTGTGSNRTCTCSSSVTITDDDGTELEVEISRNPVSEAEFQTRNRQYRDAGFMAVNTGSQNINPRQLDNAISSCNNLANNGRYNETTYIVTSVPNTSNVSLHCYGRN